MIGGWGSQRPPRTGMLGGMAITRRFALSLGAALLVGGWATMRYGLDEYIADETWLNDDGVVLCVVISMAVGAGLLGFAVLRPTIRRDD